MYFVRKLFKEMGSSNKGFGLVETLVGISIFVMISVAVYAGFVKVLQGIQVLKVKNAMTQIATEQIEIIRNLPYDDVGIVGGIPDGKIARNKITQREGIDFDVETSINDVDDPFDGTFGGSPDDTVPADYKLVQVDISCSECAFTDEMNFYTRVSPENLEGQTSSGILTIQVFDANGQPIAGANVHIENNEDPLIDIDEVTDVDGIYQILNATPGVETYEITVTKSGYSTDRTYTVGDPDNPAPDNAHANIIEGQETQISFSIDKVSDLELRTKRSSCSTISNIDFDLTSSKLIGYQTPKYDKSLQTNSTGHLSLSSMEWDNYSIDITDLGYELVGTSVLLPISLNPDTNLDIDLILDNYDPNTLLVQIVDAQTDLPLSGATVTLTNGGNSVEEVTGKGFLGQTDWSGGSGQTTYSDQTRYFSDDGNVEVNSVTGQMQLLNIGGIYISSGELVSSTIDTGTTTNFHILNWKPFDQSVGADVKIQLATNLEITATSTWDFVGPNGTSSTYYDNSGETISSSHNGDRYVRYKVYLSTTDDAVTPLVSDVHFTFASDCAPPGQVVFSNLNLDDYDISVTASGYQDFDLVGYPVTEVWELFEIIMTP